MNKILLAAIEDEVANWTLEEEEREFQWHVLAMMDRELYAPFDEFDEEEAEE